MAESAFQRVRAGSDHVAVEGRPRAASGLVRRWQVPVPDAATWPTGSPAPARERVSHALEPGRPLRDLLDGSGQPLAAPVRQEMETRLGADFSHVRVHTDGAARASAADFGARAYTFGDHVVIGDGGADKHVLAHELTHVIQQRQGPVAGTDNGSGLKVSDPSDRDERAADANAARAMRAPLSEYRPARAQTRDQGIGAAWHVAGMARDAALGDRAFTSGRHVVADGGGADGHSVAHRPTDGVSLRGAPSAARPVAVQRYLYDIPAVHGEDPAVRGNTVEVLPGSRLRYSDKDYDPRRAPNLRRKHRQQMHEPVRDQIFVDNPAYSSRMRGYLKDTISESKKVVGAANKVLNELREHKRLNPTSSRAFMIGVMETLDGNLRVANSSKSSGPVKDIVKDLDRVSKAVGEPVSKAEKKALERSKNVGSQISVVEPVSTERFERYLKVGVLSGHLNCAAPKLIMSALGAGGALDVSHMTEVWWEPEGEKDPKTGEPVWKGVLIDGVRYHHLQRVPSCALCEQNLRVLVNSEMRSVLEKEFTRESGVRALEFVKPEVFGEGNQARKELAAQQYKKQLSARPLKAIEQAEDQLSVPSLQHLPAIREPLERVHKSHRSVVNAVFDPRVTVADYIDNQLAEWRTALRQAAEDLNHSGVAVPLLNSKVKPAIQFLNQAASLLPNP